MHKPHNWVDLYVDTTTDNLLELERHAAFAKLTRLIMKTRYSKYSFALSIHSDVRAKPYRCFFATHVVISQHLPRGFKSNRQISSSGDYFSSSCGSPLPKKKTTTHLGQFRESTGE